MRHTNLFLLARYIVFGLFTICNAITCSIAAWNFGFVHFTKPLYIDVYLIFLGSFSLLSIFALVFAELLCFNSLTTRVWFECAWVALFWVMQLAGGAALTAIESELPCSRAVMAFVHVLCTSERVLLAFTWMCTIILLVYLLVLVFLAASRSHEDPEVWASDVRALYGATLVEPNAAATPYSPSITRFKKRMMGDAYATRPLRSPTQLLSRYRGLSPDYKIEPFFPAAIMAPEQMGIPSQLNLPEAIPLPPVAATGIIPSIVPRSTINTQSALGLFDMQAQPASSVSYTKPNLPPIPVPRPSPSHSPLGDWPRHDVMKQPVKRRRRSPPPSAFEFPRSQPGVALTDRPENVPQVQPRPRRPSGPRLRVPSGESVHRPPPLDLSGISNFENGPRRANVA